MRVSSTEQATQPLTERQVQVLRAVEQYVEARGGSPTLDEIRRMVGLASKSTVDEHLAALERKGFLSIQPGAHAGITVLVPSSAATVLPAKPIRRAALRNATIAELETELRRRRRAVGQR
jgi:repressor LexA